MVVIDDFHYIPEESRPELMRNVKGAVFNGLKVILLSVSHRVFDAIKVCFRTNREIHFAILCRSGPHRTDTDSNKRFSGTCVVCPSSIIETLCTEA